MSLRTILYGYEFKNGKYECCPLDRSRAMTEALMEKYHNMPSMNELDVTLIRETILKIAVNRDGTLTVTFINHAKVTNAEMEEMTL